jgi:hypothetical protein
MSIRIGDPGCLRALAKVSLDATAPSGVPRPETIGFCRNDGYWLDIAQRHATREHVQAFATWMREEVLRME